MQEIKTTDHNSASGFKMFYLLSIYVHNYTGFNILCIYALVVARLCCGFHAENVEGLTFAHVVVFCFDIKRHLDGRTMALRVGAVLLQKLIV